MIIKILFLCVENSCRSQMAEGLAEMLAQGVKGLSFFSAGSKPSGMLNPLAVRVMKEKGIDISGHISKSFEDLPYREFDIVVGMGCGDACPLFMAKQYIKWNVPDPKGKDIVYFRMVRDLIGAKVAGLLRSISLKMEAENDQAF